MIIINFLETDELKDNLLVSFPHRETSIQVDSFGFELIGRWPFGGYLGSTFGDSSYLFYSYAGGIFVYELMDSPPYKKVSEIPMIFDDLNYIRYPRDLRISSIDARFPYLYVSSSGHTQLDDYAPIPFYGLSIFDLTDFEHPLEIGRYSYIPDSVSMEMGLPNALKIYNDTLILIGFSYPRYFPDHEVLKVINVKNPSNPFEIGEFFMSGAHVITDIEIQDTLVYFSTRVSYRIYILNSKNPEQPSLITVINLPVQPLCIELKDTLLLVLTASFAEGALRIYDISEPQHPVFLSSIQIPADNVYWFEVKDNYAFVGCGGRFVIVDFSDPLNPFILNIFDKWGYGDIFYIKKYQTLCRFFCFRYYGSPEYFSIICFSNL